MFKLLLVSVTLAAVSIARSVPHVPYESVYSVANLDGLPEEPTGITMDLAIQLLDVLEKYGLTSTFGVVGVHNHMQLMDGEVAYQTGNTTATTVRIANYDHVKDHSVPYNYRITPSGDLLPLDLGEASDDACAARMALSSATTSGQFLKEFAAASNGRLAGVAYIRPLDRASLVSGGVVRNQYNGAKTEGIAKRISWAEADPKDAPSFWTRDVADPSPATISTLCDECIFPIDL